MNQELLLTRVIVLALGLQAALQPAAHAQDLLVEDPSPLIRFDDTTHSDTFDWIIEASVAADDQSGIFRIQSFINGGGQYVLVINSNATQDNTNALVIEGNGDLTFGNGAMYFDRSTSELAIGTTDTPSDLNLSSVVPDIHLIDETDDSQIDIQLNAGLFEFVATPPGTNLFRNPFKMGINAPTNSLVIDGIGNIGFGTDTPEQAVDVQRSAAAARFQLTSFTDDATQAPQYIQRRARGTAAAPLALQTNDNLGLFSFRGYTPGGFGGSRATITAQAAGNFSNDSTPTRLIFATTPVGSTAPQQVMEITHDGKVRVNGIALNVPDYVFADDYALMPLEELQSFIDQHGHLPGIASADEVQAEGLDLAGSQMSQLQKIEELTLYTLQQEAELRAMREELAALNGQAARMAQLEALVGQLLQDHNGEVQLAAVESGSHR